jgi:ribosomal-protein-alanine N-acetyltransferase
VDLQLRLYEPGDFEALYEIDQACYPPGIAYSRRALRFFLRRPGAHCLAATVGEGVIGFILSELDGSRAHIVTLDVLEPYRRKLVGSALLQAQEAHFAGQGVRIVGLETATDNLAAIAFWQKHGYRTRSVLKRYYLGRVDAFRMDKLLSTHPSSAVGGLRVKDH